MTRFRSLYTRLEHETQTQGETLPPWPAIYRDGLPPLPSEALQIKIENQLPKVLTSAQLGALPMFNENRRITSRAGWTYYGHWKGVLFQTLFTMFANPAMYPWVRIESANGQHAILDRSSLANWRLITHANNEPLNTLYGGPVWMHNFDYTVEYAIPHVSKIVLMQGDYEAKHPAQAWGFNLDDARVAPGRYYDLHLERITAL